MIENETTVRHSDRDGGCWEVLQMRGGALVLIATFRHENFARDHADTFNGVPA